ncbi:MAG: hypothetical protein FJW26_05530 [Acidimicrobiia bacterium]|nr:hypothetical protein [Acidimicrobiia bacterium]
MKFFRLTKPLWAVLLVAVEAAVADPLSCDFSQYRATQDIRAELKNGLLELSWEGTARQQLQISFGLQGAAPVIRDMRVRRIRGNWVVLGQDLRPEFHVTTGRRRISEQQLEPLRRLGLDRDAELLEREKWNVFWDAPLEIPGAAGTNPGLPRSADEIRRATASYDSRACRVKTDGARIEVSFPGLSLGIFSGQLQFTAYRGSNLLRQEAIAKTEEAAVAFHYRAGLRGFRIESAKRVVWRDVARGWQKVEFGGSINSDPVALRARNRLAIVEAGGGSLAVFPPPHKFFFGREIELNLGYVWYRKDDPHSFSVGVRQADREEMYRPYGVSDDVWQRRSRQARMFAQGNFALYNAPPGTWQRMAVYYFLSPETSATTHERVMAYTYDDRFPPLPGFQVAVSHFHTSFHEQLLDAGSLDVQPSWIPTFRALGINIAMMSDFHGDGHAKDPGPLRLPEQKAYFEGSKRHSDRDFLIMPGEEPSTYFGGHYTTVFPRPVFWTHVRQPGQPLVEDDPKYGKVYHVGSAADEMEMLRAENGLVWQAHPRTKGSSGYPDALRQTEVFRSDRFLGAAFQSLPVDLSEARLCEVRCFSTLDDMNNWGGPKYLVAEGDTYAKFPDDDSYQHLTVNYLKLGRLPSFEEDWTPIVKSLREGNFFVTSGEVLFKDFAIEGTGPQRSIVAELQWTYPLEFLELVWGNGQKTDRQLIRATDRPPFGSQRFRIPFDAAGKKWVRVAAWDSAGNGAFWQPVHLSKP